MRTSVSGPSSVAQPLLSSTSTGSCGGRTDEAAARLRHDARRNPRRAGASVSPAACGSAAASAARSALQLDDLGVAELAREERRAVLAEQQIVVAGEQRRPAPAAGRGARRASAARASRRRPRARRLLAARLVGHEHVAEAPHRLDVARAGGSASTSLRRRDTCTSIARSNTSWSRPRASSISFSRASGWRGCCANTFSSRTRRW